MSELKQQEFWLEGTAAARVVVSPGSAAEHKLFDLDSAPVIVEHEFTLPTYVKENLSENSQFEYVEGATVQELVNQGNQYDPRTSGYLGPVSDFMRVYRDVEADEHFVLWQLFSSEQALLEQDEYWAADNLPRG